MKVFLCFSKGGFSVRNRPAPPVGERPLKRTKSLLWTNPHQPPLVKSSNFCRYDVMLAFPATSAAICFYEWSKPMY